MNNDHNDELLKCHIQAKMRDDTFIVFIEKLAEKRLVPWSHLRPLRSASSSSLSREFFPTNRICGGIGQSYVDRYGYNLHGSTKSRTKRQHIDNFTTGIGNDCDAICNSEFDFEPYINLSNFTLSTSNAQREIIAYPMAYAQSGNGNSSNGGNSTANTKSMKNRQSNNAQHQTNDGDSKSAVLKIDTDNGNGNGGNGSGVGGGGQYGKGGHDSKNDSQQSNTSASSTTSHQQSYHHQQQQQHQMPEPNVIVDASTGMPAAAGHPPMSSYYHQGTVATATAGAPVYYYQTTADDQSGIYSSSDMVVPHGVYAIPAYQSTTAATVPPTMQPGMYAPAISSTQAVHYPGPVNGWPAYTQQMNPQGKCFLDFFFLVLKILATHIIQWINGKFRIMFIFGNDFRMQMTFCLNRQIKIKLRIKRISLELKYSFIFLSLTKYFQVMFFRLRRTMLYQQYRLQCQWPCHF